MTKLEKDEVICNKCNGSGLSSKNNSAFQCAKCHGAGKLDWVENVVGKNPPSNKWNVEMVGGGGGGSVSNSYEITVGAGGGGSLWEPACPINAGTGLQINEDLNNTISIDPEFKQALKDELKEQILNEMEGIIQTRVEIELQKRGIK